MKNRFLVGGIVIAIVVVVGVILNMTNKEPKLQIVSKTIDLGLFKNGSDVFMSPNELSAKLGQKNLVVLDGNHPKNYAKGHISGAISIGFKGLSRVEGKPGDENWGTILPKDKLTKKLESFGVTNDTLIVAYSDTFKGPGAGGRAVWQLRMAGLENVKLLYGGLETWRQMGLPLTKDVPDLVSSTGLVLKEYNEDHRVNHQFIEANIDTLKIVDVRSEKEFTGKDTSRGEKRGGHIKGAKWLEWTALLNPDSTPKSAKEIIKLMASIGVKPEDNFALY